MVVNAGVSQTALASTLGLIGVTVIATFLYKKWKKEQIPLNWEKVGTVKKIHLYPLKSGLRMELKKAEVDLLGLKEVKKDQNAIQLRDRCLVVYGTKDLEFRTARTYPKMVHIEVSVQGGDRLLINAPNTKPLIVKIPKKSEGQVVKIQCWQGERIVGIDCGEEAQAWFSKYVVDRDSGLGLAYFDFSEKRDITKSQKKLLQYYKNLSNKSAGLFHDLTSASLLSVPSVNDLNSRVENVNIVAEQFRHNFIVDGPGMVPYAEDDWDWIKIGEDAVFRNVKDTTRCVLTTINPETAVRNQQREPVKTLEKYRKHDGPETSPRFGSNLEVKRAGIVCLEDAVYVVKKQ